MEQIENAFVSSRCTITRKQITCLFKQCTTKCHILLRCLRLAFPSSSFCRYFLRRRRQLETHPARPAFAPGANHRSRTFSAPAHLVLVSDECSSFLKFCVYSTRQARGRCRLGGAPLEVGGSAAARAGRWRGRREKQATGRWVGGQTDRRTDARINEPPRPCPCSCPPRPCARPLARRTEWTVCRVDVQVFLNYVCC